MNSLGGGDTAVERYAAVMSGPYGLLLRTASMVGTAACVYHGYKRNNGSVGWAIGWFFVPVVIGVPLALAQGFGKPKAKANRRRRLVGKRMRRIKR